MVRKSGSVMTDCFGAENGQLGTDGSDNSGVTVNVPQAASEEALDR